MCLFTCLYLSFGHNCQVSEQSSARHCRPQLHHSRQLEPPEGGMGLILFRADEVGTNAWVTGQSRLAVLSPKLLWAVPS